jgi:anti-anti-sigma regulatory factor
VSPSSIVAHVEGATHQIIVRGIVDREGAREMDFLIRHGMWEPHSGVVIDLSRVEEVSGALVGALLRASRRLAWREGGLKIVCPRVDLRRRLEMAGLDELAEVTPTG